MQYFDSLEKARDDPDVVVIVVTGAGRAFCAGADFKLLDTIGTKNNKFVAPPPRSLAQNQATLIPKP